MPALPEWLLAVALVAVYLADSMQFLRIGEAVLATKNGAPSRLSFGSSLELGGRRPYLPNPLTPGWPALRVDWLSSATLPVPQVAEEMRRQLHAVRPIGWCATVCAALIILVAPVALVTGHQEVFVPAVLLCVAGVLAAGALLIVGRNTLALSLSQAMAIAAIALVCLPCSGNLARAACLHRRWQVRASDLAALSDEGRDAFEMRVRDMLHRARDLCAEGSAEYVSVVAELQRMEPRSQ
jgi:hypothetical protein